jgi:divalent metal cation (Fe/Co/Zn/Cd) transporter
MDRPVAARPAGSVATSWSRITASAMRHLAPFGKARAAVAQFVAVRWPAMAMRQMLLRRGLALEYVTLGWNVVGSMILLVSAAAVGSIALAGFGIDSLIEIVASAVVVWQLKGQDESRRERRALRIIAIAFLLLAIYIAVQIIVTLSSHSHPGHSALGMAWLAATVVAMFALAAAKRDTGQRLGNPVLQTEAGVTLIDGALAAAVLAGVVLNAALGWWWADPLSALVILFYALREARHAWPADSWRAPVEHPPT